MGEEPSTPVIVERIKNVQEDVTEIKQNMATRTDQAHTDQRISDLTGALEKERAERVAAVEAERKERRDEIAKVATRLQMVEDRMEARKYSTMSSVALSILGVILGLIAAFGRTIFGG